MASIWHANDPSCLLVAPGLPLPALAERLARCELRVEPLSLAELAGEQALSLSHFAMVLLVEAPGSLARSAEACEQLRRLTSPHTPLLVLLARREAAHVQGLYKVGATDFLGWPEDEALLEVRVRQALRQAEAEQERHLLRAALERATAPQCGEALGALVAGVAHEVRNPLFAISAALDAFESRFGSSAGYARYLEVLREEGARLDQLLGELLEYGRPAATELAPGPLVPVLEEALLGCRLLAERQQVEVDWAPPAAELPAVSMERRRLVQVFRNLIQSALQRSPPGGRVRVRVEPVPGQGGVQLRCTVEDQGPGFPPEDLPRLFEPFFSRRPRGMRLGLSIAHRIVEQHRGHVAMGNRPQGGAVATVLLPCPGLLTGNVIARAQPSTTA